MNYEINTVLFTRDGRITGNAIIIDHFEGDYIVQTEKGNTPTYTEIEVDKLFYTDNFLPENTRKQRRRSHKYFDYVKKQISTDKH